MTEREGSKPTQEYAIKAAGMHCENCVDGLEEELGLVPGIESVEVTFAEGIAAILLRGEEINQEEARALVAELGYVIIAEQLEPSSPAQPAPPASRPLEQPECHQ